MKKTFSLIAGAVLLFISGYAFADEVKEGTTDTHDKMITNDDLQKAVPSQDSATFNQMPGGQAEGSSAGGERSDTDTLKKEGDREQEIRDKALIEPGRGAPEPLPSVPEKTLPDYTDY